MIVDHQHIDLFGKMLFEKGVIQAPFNLSNPMNNEACFIFILEGNYKVLSETDHLWAKEKDGILMKCGHYLAEMHPSANGITKAVAIHFYPEVLEKVFGDEIPEFLKEEQPVPDPPMVRMKTDELVRKYFDSMLFYFENPELVTEELLVLKTRELFLLLNKSSSSGQIRGLLSNLFTPKTFSFKEVIRAHTYDNLSLEELADLTHMSLSSFKREFKRIFNDSPARYLRSQKLEKAKDFLLYSDKTISEIAYECGFSSLVSFSTAFQQYSNVSPSGYRQLNAKAIKSAG